MGSLEHATVSARLSKPFGQFFYCDSVGLLLDTRTVRNNSREAGKGWKYKKDFWCGLYKTVLQIWTTKPFPGSYVLGYVKDMRHEPWKENATILFANRNEIAFWESTAGADARMFTGYPRSASKDLEVPNLEKIAIAIRAIRDRKSWPPNEVSGWKHSHEISGWPICSRWVPTISQCLGDLDDPTTQKLVTFTTKWSTIGDKSNYSGCNPTYSLQESNIAMGKIHHL